MNISAGDTLLIVNDLSDYLTSSFYVKKRSVVMVVSAKSECDDCLYDDCLYVSVIVDHRVALVIVHLTRLEDFFAKLT